MQKTGSNHSGKVRTKNSESSPLNLEVCGSRIKKPLGLDHGTKSNFYQMNAFDLDREEQQEYYRKSEERLYPKGPPKDATRRAIKLNVCVVDSEQVKTKRQKQLEEALELADFRRFLQKDFPLPDKCHFQKETRQRDLCPTVVGASKFYDDNYKVYYDLLKYLVVRSHRPKSLD